MQNFKVRTFDVQQATPKPQFLFLTVAEMLETAPRTLSELFYFILQQLRRNGKCLLDILRPLETWFFHPYFSAEVLLNASYF